MAPQSPELPDGSQGPPAPLRLEGALTAYTAQELRAKMLDRLAAAPRLELDLGAVDACDCAGLQLLCAARKSALAQGKAFELFNEPAVVRMAAQAIGLTLADYANAPQRV